MFDNLTTRPSRSVPHRHDERRATLDAMVAARARRERAAADGFMLAASFADLYTAVDDDSSCALHSEHLVGLGGDGCPPVAEFAALELAARLGLRPEAGSALIGSALSVRHRLPQIWAALDALRIPVWLAEKLASITHPLPHEDCLEVSAELAAHVGRTSTKRLIDLARASVLQRMSDLASDDRVRALSTRRVTLSRSDHVCDLHAVLDQTDGLWLNAQLDRIATLLGSAGDAADHDVRRAKALGVLASPARALQLLQASLTDELPDDLDVACPAAGQRGHTCGSITIEPDRLLPRAEVVVHLSETTARTGAGLARAEKLGPLLAGWLAELLGHSRVIVRPVLDVGALAASSAYEVPPRMREAVTLRNPSSVFPFSTRAARGLDLDHIVPFDQHGPPGQTRPDNLGPLSRREHRAKTHGGWRVAQLSPGTFDWTSPLGHRYLVTPSGTEPMSTDANTFDSTLEQELRDLLEPAAQKPAA